MAKGRMLNKSISLSMKFHLLPDDTCRLLATWIIPQLDKRGVFYGDAAVVKSLVMPMRADVSVEQIREYLKVMQQIGLIHLFESNGRVWQAWPGFGHNQIGLRDNRETTDFAPPPDEVRDGCPKEDAGMTDDGSNSSGKLPEDIRQLAGELSAEKNGNEMNSNKGDASAPPAVTYEAKDMGNTTVSNPKDPADLYLKWMEQNDKSIRLLRTYAKSPVALDASLEFYRVTGIKVMDDKNAKSRLAGGQALYEACSGNLSLIAQAYKELTESKARIVDEWSLVNTCNVLASAKPAQTTAADDLEPVTLENGDIEYRKVAK